jgi:AAA+ lid domain
MSSAGRGRCLVYSLPPPPPRGAQVHARGKPIPRGGSDEYEDDALLSKVAELTIGYSGAELANLLNEAAILTVRCRGVWPFSRAKEGPLSPLAFRGGNVQTDRCG